MCFALKTESQLNDGKFMTYLYIFIHIDVNKQCFENDGKKLAGFSWKFYTVQRLL